ncbi:MAG: branched-chain amino acid ABC transporter permease [Halobaculum sp.]
MTRDDRVEDRDDGVGDRDDRVEDGEETSGAVSDGAADTGGDSRGPATRRADPATTSGAGGARVGTTESDELPVTAAAAASGTDRLRAYWERLTVVERATAALIAGFAGLLTVATIVGLLTPARLLFLVSLAGIYVLLSMSLNVQWGYTGLINFSVAAFFGVGAYTAGLLASGSSPITGGEGVLAVPILGLPLAAVAGGLLAVAIGVPTLSLRDDYLAIATLGLAEVVRIFVKNQSGITRGSRGLLGMPPLIPGVPQSVLDAGLAVTLVVGVWLFLRRIHHAPWGRVQRVIRTDEDLASALGKNVFRLRMESFVVGGMIAALAGVLFVHLNDSLFPSSLQPILTFYVWVAVILGGAGSDRGAIVGGITVVTIVQFTRTLSGIVPVDAGAVRLISVGTLIVLVMALRQDGVLPPQRELVWPGAWQDE